MKCLPGIPSTFPILFLSPTLRFQEMKIGRRVWPFAKMTSGEKGIIDPTVLHLRAIKFVTNAVVFGRGAEAIFQILKWEISGDSRKRDRFAKLLGQLVGAAKIILAGLVFRHTKPSITKPVGMLLNGPGNLLGVAALGPKREERQFFCFTERLQVRIISQQLCESAIERSVGQPVEIGQRQIVFAKSNRLQKRADFSTPERSVAQHACVDFRSQRSGSA